MIARMIKKTMIPMIKPASAPLTNFDLILSASSTIVERPKLTSFWS